MNELGKCDFRSFKVWCERYIVYSTHTTAYICNNIIGNCKLAHNNRYKRRWFVYVKNICNTFIVCYMYKHALLWMHYRQFRYLHNILTLSITQLFRLGIYMSDRRCQFYYIHIRSIYTKVKFVNNKLATSSAITWYSYKKATPVVYIPINETTSLMIEWSMYNHKFIGHWLIHIHMCETCVQLYRQIIFIILYLL